MDEARLREEWVLRVGEVVSVSGRRISVLVDRDKNVTELFLSGALIRNIAVGSYVEIKKGFVSLIGKVEGENAQADWPKEGKPPGPQALRSLSVVLVGFIDKAGRFHGGTKELPLVGNEAFLLTREKVVQVHNLLASSGLSMNFATSEYEGYDVALPIDGLMNSHIAIFGNTGSGKSNTLATLFASFISTMRNANRAAFDANCNLLFLDFNGEYGRAECLCNDKTVFRLSTRDEEGDKIPLSQEGLLDIEILSILADATEKTQRPFLRRALRLHDAIVGADEPQSYLRAVARTLVRRVLAMSDKIRADLLLDYLRQVLPSEDANGEPIDIAVGLEWHNNTSQFRVGDAYLRDNPAALEATVAFQQCSVLDFHGDVIEDFLTTAYLQLTTDVLANRAQNEHIAPAVNKLKSKQRDIRCIFDPNLVGGIFQSNVVVVDLNDVNIDMKKTIPLLLARRAYREHKVGELGRTLNIVIDEAHNILSHESAREAESWKDYRLETFEEIVKEGRKFGVFVTIASQRPNDISHTISSQAHNYFIHRLMNDRDLQAIASAVSYIDKLTEESIPTLPTGTCIFSGAAGQMPLKISIKLLSEPMRPSSHTVEFGDIAALPGPQLA